MRSTTFILIFITFSSLSQDNCKVFLWAGDTAKYTACEYLQSAPNYFQLTKEFHLVCDSAMKICPEYSRPYRSKAVSYLKTGDFVNWIKNMDKAVELDPELYLGYRGWGHFQFFRNYEHAIADFERLEKLLSTKDIGFATNGYYHLQIVKALCYKMLNQRQKAIEIIEWQLENDPVSTALYDYMHLGVLYHEVGQHDLAKKALRKQLTINPLADVYYHLSKIESSLNQMDSAFINLEKALAHYDEGKYLNDSYTHQIDKVYRIDIESDLQMLRR